MQDINRRSFNGVVLGTLITGGTLFTARPVKVMAVVPVWTMRDLFLLPVGDLFRCRSALRLKDGSTISGPPARRIVVERNRISFDFNGINVQTPFTLVGNLLLTPDGGLIRESPFGGGSVCLAPGDSLDVAHSIVIDGVPIDEVRFLPSSACTIA